MSGNRLERMLRPKSIAVIGGGAFGTNVVRQSLKMGFAGDIWPVHPTKDAVEGVKAYRTIAALAARTVSRPASWRRATMTRTASGCRMS